VNLYVAVTDNDWFRFLAQRQPDEVNFWRPSPGGFHVLGPGGLFLFKLRGERHIAGGGFFIRHIDSIPLSYAWQAYEESNGAPDLGVLRSAIAGRQVRRGDPDPLIGCTLLGDPFFLAREDWIPVPDDYSSNIRRGKTYDTETAVGAALWKAVEPSLSGVPLEPGLPSRMGEPVRRGKPQLVEPRLGQGAFRMLVAEAYARRCAMTGQRALPVLQAAHIKAVADSGPHLVENGLLLRSDLHILFDRGYLTVTEEHKVEVSRSIKEEFENGEEYYAMHGQDLLVLPAREVERPALEFLRWHNEQVYRG
jgi:putative restriction endonuclease